MKDWLSDLAGRTHDLIEEVATADLVVMVSSAGTSAEAASVIAEACNVRKVMTTALVIGSENKSDEELSKTLASLRPYASMLVIANNDEYIEEMLIALRA
jgi:cell division GTPase FtsZ